MTILNEALAERQKITKEQRDNLSGLYSYMSELLEQASDEGEISKKKGKQYAKKMKDLEFSLQENWNFPQDPLCHTWWNKFAQCQCPTMDNNERFGYEKIIAVTCPYHGI